MNLVLLAHSHWHSSRSMPRFCRMIAEGMKARGHQVAVWQPEPHLNGWIKKPAALAKWLGYGDSYIFFPRELQRRAAAEPRDTLFVFLDQALGMWIPCLRHRPHVVHCHDFFATRSALGEFPENRVKWTGRRYQALIQNGFAQARNFISISQASRQDLHRFLSQRPEISEVVYNGLNFDFKPVSTEESQRLLADIPEARKEDFLLHVGGNQWYKNRLGVLKIYEALVRRGRSVPPLWMVGAPPAEALKQAAREIPAPGKVIFLSSLDDRQVRAIYSRAALLIFPSLEEGFGWPIIEAMACGCLVLTTGKPPMNEVGGEATFYLNRLPANAEVRGTWAMESAAAAEQILTMTPETKEARRQKGLKRAREFSKDQAIQAYESVYEKILAGVTHSQSIPSPVF